MLFAASVIPENIRNKYFDLSNYSVLETDTDWSREETTVYKSNTGDWYLIRQVDQYGRPIDRDICVYPFSVFSPDLPIEDLISFHIAQNTSLREIERICISSNGRYWMIFDSVHPVDRKYYLYEMSYEPVTLNVTGKLIGSASPFEMTRLHAEFVNYIKSASI